MEGPSGRATGALVLVLALAGCRTIEAPGSASPVPRAPGAAAGEAGVVGPDPASAPGGPSPGVGAPRASGPPTPAPRVFRLGRIPYRSARAVFSEAEEVFSGVIRSMGYDRLEIVTARDYDDVVGLLSRGKVDAAWLGTIAYARARLDATRGLLADPPVPVAIPIRDGRTYYQGTIIVHRQSGIMELGQLEGRRVAFVDPESASGFVFARGLLEAAGVRVPQDLVTAVPGRPDFLGRHDTVALAVYMRKFDAGAVFDQALEEIFKDERGKAQELLVLGRTKRIVNEPIVVRASTPTPVRSRLEQALLAWEPPRALTARPGGLTGFARGRAEDYREVEGLLEGMGR